MRNELTAHRTPSLKLVADQPAAGRQLLRVEGVSRVYGQVTAVRDVNLSMAEGESLSIVGRSGSGKSTLLHLLAGLDTPDSGHILVGGRDLVGLSEDQLAAWRHKEIGLVFQSFHLIPTLSALENVAFPLYPDPLPAAQRRARALERLEQVGLAQRAQHRPSQLSGGEQQRVAIARALINDPAIILADEPTGNLDSQTSDEVLALFDRLNRERGVALVIITHDEKVAAAAHRVVRMADGRIVS
ncbi:MAG: ABC transporter ATP-binding protein [Chloroflexota bacterium]